MHGLTWRELEGHRPDHGHQGTDNRPGNRRHEGPGSYRQTSCTFQFPTRLSFPWPPTWAVATGKKNLGGLR
jgi:hypothetical protein